MGKCDFCEFYNYLKAKEKDGLPYRYNVALITSLYCSQGSYAFKGLYFCPLCGKKLDGEKEK